MEMDVFQSIILWKMPRLLKFQEHKFGNGLKYNIWLDNGKQVTKKYFFKILNEELQKFKNNDKIEETKTIFIELCTSKKLIDFLTLKCYDTLHTFTEKTK